MNRFLKQTFDSSIFLQIKKYNSTIQYKEDISITFKLIFIGIFCITLLIPVAPVRPEGPAGPLGPCGPWGPAIP